MVTRSGGSGRGLHRSTAPASLHKCAPPRGGPLGKPAHPGKIEKRPAGAPVEGGTGGAFAMPPTRGPQSIQQGPALSTHGARAHRTRV